MRTGRYVTAPVVPRRPLPGETAAPSNAVLALQRAAGNRATTRLLQRRTQKGYAGLKLGRNRAGREVEIKRELGTLGGYDDRLQAVAAARLAGIDPAAVGRDTTGRWHAFELTGDFHGATYAPAAGAALTEVVGLPSAAGIAAQQTTVATLKAHTGDVAAQLNAATKDLYALILGVDGGEVLLNRSSFDRKAGKINVTTALTGKLGAHGRESRQDESFEPGAKSAFELSPNAFTTPARAQAVLFHEVSHLKDYELTQRWVTEYEKGHTFVGGPGVTYFQNWLQGQGQRGGSATGVRYRLGRAGDDRGTRLRPDVHRGVRRRGGRRSDCPARRLRQGHGRREDRDSGAAGARTRSSWSSKPSWRHTASGSAALTSRPSTSLWRPPSRRTRNRGSPGSSAAEGLAQEHDPAGDLRRRRTRDPQARDVAGPAAPLRRRRAPQAHFQDACRA